MFDLRPMKESGDLDVERIKKIDDFLDLRFERWTKKKNAKKRPGKISKIRKEKSLFGKISVEDFKRLLAKSDSVVFLEESRSVLPDNFIGREAALKELEAGALEDLIMENRNFEPAEEDLLKEEIFDEFDQCLFVEDIKEELIESETAEIREDLIESPSAVLEEKEIVSVIPILTPDPGNVLFQKTFGRSLLAFASAGLMVLLVISGLSVAGRSLGAKENILSSALEAYQSMIEAKDSAKQADFSGAQVNFQSAFQDFFQAEQELNNLGGILVATLSKIPLTSKVASADALIQAGEALAKAGWNFAAVGDFLAGDKTDFFGGEQSFSKKILGVQKQIKEARLALAEADKNLAKVKTKDLPENFVSAVADLKEKTPVLLQATQGLETWSEVALEIFGEKRAKKYLLIFQNPSEARATGGFIGTYGVLDLDQGQVKNLFIDGIFDLDGQLLEKVTPPRPIQKISTAWSTHDANWFADFSVSAEKIMWFFEKSGGETVDGVISLTPAVFEKLLAVAGPVELPQYQTTLGAANFLETIQYKVEADYDKELNQPKKILADFAPLFLEKLKAAGQDKSREILNVLAESLAQKDILFYFSDAQIQKVFSAQGWSGEILPSDKDYLNVINTNINGFKTDRMIEQKISLQTQVQPDGSLINTVKIIRTHQGGQSEYDWYNKVNADYLRVYVPLGSKLLSARGQTLEINKEPIDYKKQDFKTDADVLAQEQTLKIDQNSGTQVFEESGKTVFGNWVYASPGESAEITYQYLLPFKIDWQKENGVWSLLVQKQAGSKASSFDAEIIFPEIPNLKWQYPTDLKIDGQAIKFSGELDKDKLFGAILTK